MKQVYSPLSSQNRKALRDAFLEHLRQRNGEADVPNRKLSKREEYFRQIDANPVRSKRQIDLETFQRNQDLRRPEPGLDPVMLFLLCCAKSNRGERYGVEIQLAHMAKMNHNQANLDDPLVFLNLEEFYHTRILLDVLKIFGIETTVLEPSSSLTRWMIKAMVYLPEALTVSMVLAGEIHGVMTFDMMRKKAVELFSDEPEVLARIQSLIQEIMVDEIGHVMFARSRMGGAGLKVAELMQPAITKSCLDDEMELIALFSQAEYDRAFEQIDQTLEGYDDLSVKPFHFEPSQLVPA